MTEQQTQTPTLVEGDVRALSEPDRTTDDVVILGENNYEKKDVTTDDVVIRGDNSYEGNPYVSENSGFSDEHLKLAIARELDLFDKWLDLKVKDELMVQLYRAAEDKAVNVHDIAGLLESLIKDERDSRLQSALKIDRFDIPQAQLNPRPTGISGEYSRADLELLDFQYSMQVALVDELAQLTPDNQEGYMVMAHTYIERLIDSARQDVSVLKSEQGGLFETASITESGKTMDQIVEELTRAARQLAL